MERLLKYFIESYLRLPESFRARLRRALPPQVLDRLDDSSLANVRREALPRGHHRFARNSFTQQGEDLVLERVLRSVIGMDPGEKGTYCDVGAYHPLRGSVTNRLHIRGWRGISFDASAKSERLFGRYRPSDQFVQAVVGKEDETEVSFYLADEGNGYSQLNSKYPVSQDGFVQVSLRQVNLTAELSRLGVSQLDVLCLDIEGAEHEVLASFNFRRFKPSVIVVEIHVEDLSQVVGGPIGTLLMEHGYRLVASCVITHFFALTNRS